MQHLKDAGFCVDQAKNDADTFIFETALRSARNGQAVSVVANDTDILILLLYHHCTDVMSEIFMHYDTSKKIGVRQVNITAIARSIGKAAVQQVSK